MARKVVFIGASGEMSRLAIRRFAVAGKHYELLLCDIRPELLEPLARELPNKVEIRKVDLFDANSLRSAIAGADLVVLGAGPYMRTSAPVVEACLELRVPYLDFDDDVESTEHALSLHDKAKAAGIPIYVGCGASPGASNVMAMDAASDLDTVENIDLCWVVGDERPNVGLAVLEHMMHIAAGPCVTWEHGRRVVHDGWVETATVAMGGGLGPTLMHETAHPEAVTLPRLFPDAQRIRVIGGLDPAPFNGAARGLGLAIQQGKIGMKEGIVYMQQLMQGRFFGNLKGLRHVLGGMFAQIGQGESSWSETIGFLAKSMIGRRYKWRGGITAIVYGTRDGLPAVSTRRTPLSGPQTYYLQSMASVTGTACAAFMVLALDEAGKRSGAFAPEDWAAPQDFYRALERVGVPRNEIVETIAPATSKSLRKAA